jgi:O-antigen/teichoic acid export membrane protein
VVSYKLLNLKGDLFTTAFCFTSTAIIKLASSLILTRILDPEAYGIITIIMSIVFVIEMLADIGVTVLFIRAKDAEESWFLNTAWTIRLGRAVLNSSVLFVCAPLICTRFYHLPTLLVPLRVFSLFFLVAGFESMSFPLAIRRKQAYIVNYSDLIVTLVCTVFAVVYCYYFRSYWGLLFSTLLSRILMSALSYCFYRDERPRIELNSIAAREIFRYSRFAMPSSFLTLALSQFDKVVLLRLFDLRLLGVYGVAANVTGPIEGLIQRISQTVLYPRCAHNFRLNRETFSLKYYTDNLGLFIGMLIVPATVGGAARFVISVLYPSRYAAAGAILQALMLRAALLSLGAPAEDLLFASGETQVILVGNVLRATWLLGATFAGYFFFGFMGFMYAIALSGLPPLIYFLMLQRKKGMLIPKYEFYKLAFICATATLAYWASDLLRASWPGLWSRT